MRLDGLEQSGNIEDRRGMPAAGGLAVGGGMGTLVIMFLAFLLGANPLQILQQAGPPPGAGAVAERRVDVGPADNDPERIFVARVLKLTENVWQEQFRQQLGQRYIEPTLVLFENRVRSACGTAGASVGPFYCPGDSNVYLDLSFFRTLSRELGATGDTAKAYVIAHEVGHHVQNLLGISSQVQRAQGRSNQTESNRLSVRTELQADYLAGVFIHHAQKRQQILEPGDLEEAINAAKRIGDDVLSGGRVPEDLFTHGSSEQRVKWLRMGLESGDLSRMMQPFEQDFESL